MENVYKGKRILITGAAGTIGSVLINKLLQQDVKEVKALDNNESELFYLNDQYRKEPRYNGFYADIRDLDRLKYLAKNIDIILHAAAMKHVIISELSPFDAVKTNAEGTLNVISAALESPSVNRVIYTSSDKAVNSTNVMGTTKLLGERLMTSAANLKGTRNIIFSSTRFGNVIGSRGSVVPIFYKQIKEGKNLTITDERMTRFFMTAEEAVNLVIEASLLAKGGEVFITKMPVMRIMDLAAAMVNLVAPKFGRRPEDIEIEFIGAKPGEKLYEELMTEEETARTYELQHMFMVKPSIPPIYEHIDYDCYETIISKEVDRPYISSTEQHMSVDDIKNYLIRNNILACLESGGHIAASSRKESSSHSYFYQEATNISDVSEF
ncbi:SDR family NAD(P)-dependent oxidoreductase [Legionella oakridgensis]|uniref:NAD dependent epimerase/dehydratase n=2 Tax=Legionella oakridgensis TaxID=29423 RepID=A0A0W0X148_9GAMM|nr:SDR family NAD(P)-dependent oxidoreductase [Legionella oakridgensis]AHE65644.1 putative nucleoside-diphosphate sugar epimerase [Legionella oakridgensis ATCC 33761 = DSM 21215]KTD38269.1 NAD dependent epimerase/dehydratase [Legionella oakridgensis]STY15599.1 NAD dependent epimerase/dehydratase [Legionella longbeachae]